MTGLLVLVIVENGFALFGIDLMAIIFEASLPPHLRSRHGPSVR